MQSRSIQQTLFDYDLQDSPDQELIVSLKGKLTSLINSRSDMSRFRFTDRSNPHSSKFFDNITDMMHIKQKIMILNYLQFTSIVLTIKKIIRKNYQQDQNAIRNGYDKQSKKLFSLYTPLQRKKIDEYFKNKNTYHAIYKSFNSLSFIVDHNQALLKEWLILKGEAEYMIKLQVYSLDQHREFYEKMIGFLSHIKNYTTESTDESELSVNSISVQRFETLTAIDTDILDSNLDYLIRVGNTSDNTVELNQLQKDHMINQINTLNLLSSKGSYYLELMIKFEKACDNIINRYSWELVIEQGSIAEIKVTTILPMTTELSSSLFPEELILDSEFTSISCMLKDEKDSINSIEKLMKLAEKNTSIDLLDTKAGLMGILSKHEANYSNFDNEVNKIHDYYRRFNNTVTLKGDIATQYAMQWRNIFMNFFKSKIWITFEAKKSIRHLSSKIIDEIRITYKNSHQIQTALQPVVAVVSADDIASNNMAIQLLISDEMILEPSEDFAKDFLKSLLQVNAIEFDEDKKHRLALIIGKIMESNKADPLIIDGKTLKSILADGHARGNWSILRGYLQSLISITHLEKFIAEALKGYVDSVDDKLNSDEHSFRYSIKRLFTNMDIKKKRTEIVADIIQLINENQHELNDEKLRIELEKIVVSKFSNGSTSKLLKKLKPLIAGNVTPLKLTALPAARNNDVFEDDHVRHEHTLLKQERSEFRKEKDEFKAEMENFRQQMADFINGQRQRPSV